MGFNRIYRAAFFAGVLLIAAGAGCSGPAPQTTNPVQQTDVARFDRNVLNESFTGLVVAFASWCGPCREELPEIVRLHRSGMPKGTRIVAISLDEGNPRPVQRLVDELNLPFPVYQVGMKAAAHFEIIGVPTVLVVQKGRILERIPGRQTFSQLAARLEKLSRPAL